MELKSPNDSREDLGLFLFPINLFLQVKINYNRYIMYSNFCILARNPK